MVIYDFAVPNEIRLGNKRCARTGEHSRTRCTSLPETKARGDPQVHSWYRPENRLTFRFHPHPLFSVSPSQEIRLQPVSGGKQVAEQVDFSVSPSHPVFGFTLTRKQVATCFGWETGCKNKLTFRFHPYTLFFGSTCFRGSPLPLVSGRLWVSMHSLTGNLTKPVGFLLGIQNMES